MGKQRFTKTEFKQAIEDSDGHIGVIAYRLNVSRTTVYRYLDRYPELAPVLDAERKSGRDEIVEMAQNKLKQGIASGDDARADRLLMFALRHYDKEGVPGAVGMADMFSPDVAAWLKENDITPSDAVKEFEAIIRAQMAKA